MAFKRFLNQHFLKVLAMDRFNVAESSHTRVSVKKVFTASGR